MSAGIVGFLAGVVVGGTFGMLVMAVLYVGRDER